MNSTSNDEEPEIQTVRRAIRDLAHAALPPLLHMSEPSGGTVLANTRFHEDLLGLEVLYLIA